MNCLLNSLLKSGKHSNMSQLIGVIFIIIGAISLSVFWPPIIIGYLIAIGYYLINKEPTKFYW